MKSTYIAPKSNCIKMDIESPILSVSNVYHQESDATPFSMHKRSSDIWNSMTEENHK